MAGKLTFTRFALETLSANARWDATNECNGRRETCKAKWWAKDCSSCEILDKSKVDIALPCDFGAGSDSLLRPHHSSKPYLSAVSASLCLR